MGVWLGTISFTLPLKKVPASSPPTPQPQEYKNRGDMSSLGICLHSLTKETCGNLHFILVSVLNKLPIKLWTVGAAGHSGLPKLSALACPGYPKNSTSSPPKCPQNWCKLIRGQVGSGLTGRDLEFALILTPDRDFPRRWEWKALQGEKIAWAQSVVSGISISISGIVSSLKWRVQNRKQST